MRKTLPSVPHVDWLRKTAKQRLIEMRALDASARMHQAQLAFANDYGFANWHDLKARVDALAMDAQIIASARYGRALDLDRLLTHHPRKIALTGGEWNRPLLHLAAGHGQLECVNVLLLHGFDVRTRDRLDNATALHWAAQFGSVEVVKRLIDAGADVDGEGDRHELGVIGWATCFDHVHREVARYLLSRGAKLSIFAAVSLNRADFVQKLVADDHTLVRTRKMSRFEHYRTPLHLAVLKNRPQMVKLLLSLGADPAANDSLGYTPLGLATAKTNLAIVSALIGAGANPKERFANRFERVIPILVVSDMPASIEYYVDKLGFEKRWEWGDPPDFACVARDQVELFLSLSTKGVPPAWVSIFVRDVDALHETCKASGAIIREPPADYPWGMREMTVEDLDGNRLRMGGEGGGEHRSD